MISNGYESHITAINLSGHRLMFGKHDNTTPSDCCHSIPDCTLNLVVGCTHGSQPASARAFARDSARADAGWERANLILLPSSFPPSPSQTSSSQSTNAAPPIETDTAGRRRLWILRRLAAPADPT